MIRRGLLHSLMPLAVIIGASLWGYTAIDAGARLPVHWSLAGQADRFCVRDEALLILPFIAVGVTLLFAVLPALDPRGGNIIRSARAYLVTWLGTLWLLALAQISVVLTATELWRAKADSLVPGIAVLGAAILTSLVGNYLGKTRPNWIIGVRTPWTLTSDITWERTHRFSGRLLVAAGIVSAATTFIYPAAGLIMLVVSVLGAIAASAAYSYLIWRNAPDKQVGLQAAD